MLWFDRFHHTIHIQKNCCSRSLHKKPYFLFPTSPKRQSFQKNCTGIWTFLYYQERQNFFLPKIWSYSLDGKKYDFSEKRKQKTWKYDAFFKCSVKIAISKKSHWNMIFFVTSGNLVFLFLWKYDIVFLNRK